MRWKRVFAVSLPLARWLALGVFLIGISAAIALPLEWRLADRSHVNAVRMKKLGVPNVPQFSMIALPEGTPAPGLNLPAVSGVEPFRLAEFRGIKPVVLVFGSFTCDLLQARLPDLETVYKEYKDRVAFAFIITSEAGHQLPGFEFLLTPVNRDPSSGSRAVRRQLVRKAMTLAGCSIPGYLDTPNDEAARLYAVYPARLVVVDRAGCIARNVGMPAGNNIEGWTDLARVLEEQCSLRPTPATTKPQQPALPRPPR
jgi:hypothetical protein